MTSKIDSALGLVQSAHGLFVDLTNEAQERLQRVEPGSGDTYLQYLDAEEKLSSILADFNTRD